MSGVFHRSRDRKSTRLNSSHLRISYAVFCLKKIIRSLEKHPGLSCSEATLNSDVHGHQLVGVAVEEFPPVRVPHCLHPAFCLFFFFNEGAPPRLPLFPQPPPFTR